MEGKDWAILVLVAFLALIAGAALFSTHEVTVEKELITVPGNVTVVEKEVLVEDPRVALVLEKQFEHYVDGVEENCFEALEDELDREYFEDLLEESGVDVDKVRRYTIDEDDVVYTILSYDEDEDDEDKAEVEAEVKVRYTLNEGSATPMKKTVLVSGVCEYDDREPEFHLD